MIDEETTPEEVEELTDEEVEPSTESVEEEEVEETEVEEEQKAEEVEETPKAEEPSKREVLRIQSLISKMKQETPKRTPDQPEGLNYGTALDADPETVQQLESDRQNYGQNLYNQGIKQAESIQFHTRLEIDAPKMEQKYPQLDQNSSEFNPAVTNALNEWYLATAGFNPETNAVQNADVRYSDFVDGIMELADEMAGRKNTASVKNIAKQSASTGLRPDGSSAKRLNLNQSPEAMTDEELDAIINSSL
jgi:hypothetical protein